MNGNSSAQQGVPPSTEGIVQPTASAPTPQPQVCRYCSLEGEHPEAAEPNTCGICGRVHGTIADVLDRRSGKAASRRVVVIHSLEGVGREGGRKPDGQWVNPTGLWRPDPICNLCAAALKCATYEAQKAAAKGDEPRWPRFWALHLAVEEAAIRNAVDAADRAAQPRFDAEVQSRGDGFRKAVLCRLWRDRSAGLAAALDAELEKLAPLDVLVRQFGTWVRRVVFSYMRDQRCSLEDAIKANRAEIEAEGTVQLKLAACLKKGAQVHRDAAPSSDDRRTRDDRRGPHRERDGRPSNNRQQPYGGRNGRTHEDRGRGTSSSRVDLRGTVHREAASSRETKIYLAAQAQGKDGAAAIAAMDQ